MRLRHAVLIAMLACVAMPAKAENPNVALAVPAASMDFAFAYIAEDKGMWKKQGIDVEIKSIAGLGSVNALFGGAVEFAAGSGSTAITASAREQKPMVVAVVRTKLPFDIVVSKQLATTVDPKADIATRAKILANKVIAVDRPGTFQHGFARYVLSLTGPGAESAATYTPMTPSAMPAALETGRIDAFSAPPPWSTLAVDRGVGVKLVSPSSGDLPELSSLAVLLIMARGDYCVSHADICRKFLAGVKDAMRLLREQPDEAFEVVRKRFADLDPKSLQSGFDDTRAAYNTSLEMTEEMFRSAEALTIQSGIIKPEEKRSGSFAGIFDNSYLR